MVFTVFYGLDWIATVPPTLALCRTVLDESRGTIIYGWVFAAHQIGAAVAATLAGYLRVRLGDYSAAFYGAALLCIVAAVAVLSIREEKPARLLEAITV